MTKSVQITLKWLTGDPEWIDYIKNKTVEELCKDPYVKKGYKAMDRLVKISNTGITINNRDEIIRLYEQFTNIIYKAENEIDTSRKDAMCAFLKGALASTKIHINVIKAMCILYDIRQKDVLTTG